MATSVRSRSSKRFDSREQEAFLNLWRTYDCLKALEDELFSRYQLSAQQYNALRLLRSVSPGSMQTLALGKQHSGDVYDRLVLELLLYRRTHPERTVYGQVLFLDVSGVEPDWPWADWLGRGPLLVPVYLDTVLAEARQRQPDHPLLAVFLPLVANAEELAQQAPMAWRGLETPHETSQELPQLINLSRLISKTHVKTTCARFALSASLPAECSR